MLGILCVGYSSFGAEFFTLHHFLQVRGLRYVPIIGLPIFAIAGVWLIFVTLDTLLGLPCYFGVSEGHLVINCRRRVLLSQLDLDRMHVGGAGGSIVEIASIGDLHSPVRIPSLMTDCTAEEIIAKIRALLGTAARDLT